MKKIFLAMLALSFIFTGTAFALVQPPKEPIIPLDPEQPVMSPNPTPAPDQKPSQTDPGTPVNVTEPSKGSGSTGITPIDGKGSITPPNNNKVYPESNYDIFGHNTPDSRPWVLLCCLCILTLVVIGIAIFIVILHKRKLDKNSAKLPGLNK